MIHAKQIVDAINFDRLPSFETKRDVRTYINNLREVLTLENFETSYRVGLKRIKEEYIIYYYSQEFIKLARTKFGRIRNPRGFKKPSKINKKKKEKGFTIIKAHDEKVKEKKNKNFPSSSIYDAAIVNTKPIYNLPREK